MTDERPDPPDGWEPLRPGLRPCRTDICILRTGGDWMPADDPSLAPLGHRDHSQLWYCRRKRPERQI